MRGQQPARGGAGAAVAVRAVGAQDATLVSAFTPLIPFGWAYGQGQVFTGLEMLGAALIVAAICAHNVWERRRARMTALAGSTS